MTRAAQSTAIDDALGLDVLGDGGGPAGSLLDTVDRLIDRGVMIKGDLILAIASVDLVRLDLGLMLAAIETLQRAERRRAARRGEASSAPASGRSEPPPAGEARRTESAGRPEPCPSKQGASARVGEPARHEDAKRSNPAPSSSMPASSGLDSSGLDSSGLDLSGLDLSAFDAAASGPSAFEPTAPQARPEPAAPWTVEPASGPPPEQTQGRGARVDLDPKDAERGLAKLVLALIEFVRRLLERQAIRRMEGGSLPDDAIDRMGEALFRLEDKVAEMARAFGLEPSDLDLDLGPLGSLNGTGDPL